MNVIPNGLTLCLSLCALLALPSAFAQAPQPVKFTVQSTLTQQMVIEQAAEMAGLPSVKGTIMATVQLVDDPDLADPLPPLPALLPDDPAVLARMADFRESDSGSELVFVSATVYDHSRTLLRCHLGGGDGKEISVWSNLDFNHFGGLCSLQITLPGGEIRDVGLVMGLGNEDIPAVDDRRMDLPDLASGGPAFRLIEGDSNDANAMGLVQGMHDLYRLEGAQMAVAYLAKTQAEDARRAYLLANPPVPKDVTIQFWKRESVSSTGMKKSNEGVK